MKKLIIVCTVMVLALVMAMPCFASEEYVTLFGKIEASEDIMQDVLQSDHGARFDGEITYNGKQYTYLYINKKVNTFRYVQFVNDDGEYVNFYEDTISKTGFTGSNTFIIKGTFIPEYAEMWKYLGRYTPLVSVGDWLEPLDNMQEQITVVNVVQVLVVLATAVVGLVFMWWGVRKLSYSLIRAFKKGKISV